MGEYEKAKGFYERAIKIQTKIFGPHYVDIATTCSNLGWVYFSEKLYEKAQRLYERALDIQTKVFGYSHGNTATTYNNLGSVHLAMGEYAKAKESIEQAVEIQTKAFGSDHVYVAAMYNNLNLVYMKLEKCNEAKDLYKKTLDIGDKAEIIDTVATFNNSGCAFSNFKEYEMSIHNIGKALGIETKVFPTDQFNNATVLQNLIFAYDATKENDKAENLLKRALKFGIGKSFSSAEEITKEVDSCNFIDSIKLLPDFATDEFFKSSILHAQEKRKQERDIDCTMKAMADLALTVDTSVDAATEMKKPETSLGDEVEDDDEFFEKNFLDEDCGIRDDVRKLLKSFPWICGGYGVRWEPYLSLYVTVAAERQNDEDALRKEIDEKFGWKASRYFEFKPEPKEKSQFRLLSDLRVEKRENGPNPMRKKKDKKKIHEAMAKGSVTMFCNTDKKHYALTCFHNSCITDRQAAGIEFNFSHIWEDIKQLCERISRREIPDENRYYYFPLMGKEIKLGAPCFRSFNENTDIMAIEVIDCKKITRTPFVITETDWKTVKNQLKKGNAKVQKRVGGALGKIFDISYSYLCKETGCDIFSNVITIECECPFLKDGDSGMLIYFYNEDTEKHIPLGYGVSEHKKDDGKIVYLAFRLDVALKNLNLKKCRWYLQA
ncbi:uncharacterized protein LOC124443338 [Xenia sp. Carnegie-2017]|uniref:uncharacterized protein LOC124443338 n=1 Tax=Xenia sp. Carnegie-2017 TaxID=2897299 RepID=UPI001F03611A|nr:uncharacterized protein LOC124443338 [Xenia sp. Carnegie-2017]